VQSSLKALYRKLIVKGFSKEAGREAIEIVRLRGFVDEEDIALRRAELMVGKLWGRTRILKKLFEEGFPGKVIEHVSESLEDIDFAENCARAIEKKYSFIPKERQERDKMYAALIRLGYSSSDIKRAMANIHVNE
jgi:SOS response regulatory protein OraA/RecX